MISLKFTAMEEAIEYVENTLRLEYDNYTLDLENGVYVAEFKESELKPLFDIGDKFSVHFDYYKPNERTEHIITKIDTSFEEANEIVYWSKESVFITESQMIKDEVFTKALEIETKDNLLSGDIWVDVEIKRYSNSVSLHIENKAIDGKILEDEFTIVGYENKLLDGEIETDYSNTVIYFELNKKEIENFKEQIC